MATIIRFRIYIILDHYVQWFVFISGWNRFIHSQVNSIGFCIFISKFDMLLLLYINQNIIYRWWPLIQRVENVAFTAFVCSTGIVYNVLHEGIQIHLNYILVYNFTLFIMYQTVKLKRYITKNNKISNLTHYYNDVGSNYWL